MKTNREYYDEFARGYERERHRGYHAMLDDLEFGLIEEACRGARVLEVGCGTGLILRRVRPIAASAVGVDVSPGMLERAIERGLEVVQGDAARLPLADESFDVVYSFKVLAHVRAIDEALSEIERVLRPGGRAFLEFYNPLSLRFAARRLGGAKRISARTKESAVYTRWDTPGRIERRLPDGLSLERFAGVRVATPVAAAHKLPLLGGALRLIERAARDSPAARFGGFLVAVVRRRDRA